MRLKSVLYPTHPGGTVKAIVGWMPQAIRCTIFPSTLTFTWNWLDNFLFIPLEDETTMGLFNWIGYIITTGNPALGTKAAW
ncbi:MAG TPA: hypothetical protein VMV49_18055 [Candidatus Deferrimicrobium sp.]|nr:hypothetical protein [Candidatus Deferrimicrobium sp.]